MGLRVLTLNAGLLHWMGGLLKPVPYVNERAKALPDALRSVSADLLFLQEVYRDTDRARLYARLKHIYPYVANGPEGSPFRLASSLMVLSKYPLESSFQRFSSAPMEELLLDQKGVLTVTLESPVGMLAAHCIHMTAGGLRQPQAFGVDSIRRRQVFQLLKRANKETRGVSLIAGDLNAGPGVSEDSYQMVVDAGYVDAYAAVHSYWGGHTWEPWVSLNQMSRHRKSPAQRIDHVFVRGLAGDGRPIRPLTCELVFREPRVSLPGRSRAVPLSDHYGVLTELTST